ncbi:MAG: hemerythrin domain-containing protein [Candidatus Latescibacterota bacterium]|nr:MAG: hemerythrin domain-containing protein [Candidatus Latescibacterota bacterium]
MKVDDPIELLKREHDSTLERVDRMELAVADLNGARQKEALELLKNGLQFLENEVRAHGALEEEVLYPALGRHVPKQTIDVMLDEHKELWWEMDLLGNALSRQNAPINEVRWHATALIDLLRRHIDKENNVIFLMTAQMLSEEEYRDLTAALTRLHQGRREDSHS